MSKMMKKLKSQLGLAMDEAILAGVMAASFGVFVAVNVPWGDILGTGTNVVDEMRQIEQANAEFYASYKLWPHQTTDGDWKRNVAALVSPQAMRYPYNIMTRFTNFLPEKGTNATELVHNLGEKGGSIMQRPVNYRSADYIEIIFESVPLQEARQIDIEIDGTYDPEEGRVYFVFDETEGFVNIHYRANEIIS